MKKIKNRLSKIIDDKVKKKLEGLARKTNTEGLRLLRGHVPIDREILIESIESKIIYHDNSVTVRFYVKQVSLDYGTKAINARMLAKILAFGKRNDVILLRTRDQLFAKRREQTRAWFYNAIDSLIKTI